MQLLMALILLAGPQNPAGAARITGTWEGRMNDLPAVTIELVESNGKLSGTVVFYFMTRPTTTDPWKIERKMSTPMLEPKFDGRMLSFKVSHENAHPGVTGPSDPPVPFELTITAEKEAKLTSTYGGPPTELKMVKVK
jgi:hypothetical protein